MGLFITFWLIFVTPKRWVIQKPKSATNTPDMAFRAFTLTEISTEGLKQRIEGLEAKQYDKKILFTQSQLFRIHEERKESLFAQKIDYTHDSIILSDKVLYKNDKNVTISSNRIHFDVNNSIIKSLLPVEALIDGNHFHAEQLSYFLNEKRMHAQHVHIKYRSD
jgi:LPS export ABC transporter protein LptC